LAKGVEKNLLGCCQLNKLARSFSYCSFGQGHVIVAENAASSRKICPFSEHYLADFYYFITVIIILQGSFQYNQNNFRSRSAGITNCSCPVGN
jgi:hypothetical protein